jgi:hypothetical protein
LERLLKGRISIVIAHRLSTILNADKIIVVEHVQVVEIDRHQELLNRQGLYSTLFSRAVHFFGAVCDACALAVRYAQRTLDALRFVNIPRVRSGE